MKRVFTILLATVLLLSLFGCGKPKYITEGKLGDTLKTDVAEVTLLNFGFAEEGVLVDPDAPDIFCTPASDPAVATGNAIYDNFMRDATELIYIRRTKDKALVYLELNVKYYGKETLTQSLGMPVIVCSEDEEYKLSGLDAFTMSRLCTQENRKDGVYYRQDGDTWSGFPMFWPNDTDCLCRGVARIPVEMEENTDAPLKIAFNLPTGEGENVRCTFTIR